MKIYKRNSKEYKNYINEVISRYNTNGKKTILFVCDSAYPMVDGVWHVLNSCATILNNNYPDYNVMLLAPDYDGKVFVENFPVLSVRSSFLHKWHYQLALPMFDFLMKRLVRRLKVDIIHCHSPFFCALYARKLHIKRKIPMVTTFHSQFKQDFMKATKSKALVNFGMHTIMKVFNGSDEVWTMHTASRNTLYSYGFTGKCRLMPNATSMRPAENYDEVRQSFRMRNNVQNKVVFVFVGRLITQKGIMFMVDVLAKLREMGLDFQMFFVGDGPDEKRLKNKVETCNLQNCVQFTGGVLQPSKLVEYYCGADLFLFPSKYDVSSIVQIEAATYKTPTVFSEGSVTSCTVQNNVNGFMLPYDVEKFAQGVWDIVHSGNMQQVGENALRDLHVSWDEIVKENVAVYEELMQNYNKHRR